MHPQKLRCALLIGLLAACKGPEDTAECPVEVSLAVTSSVPDLVSADLVVRGTVIPSRDVTIRSVSVNGIQAEADSFNYSDWSATVPLATLLAALPNGADEATLPIVVSDACGQSTKDELRVVVNRHPEVRLEMLSLAATPPAGRTFLPADGSASAALVLSGNPEARGAAVTLDTNGTAHFEGAGDAPTVVLAGDGVGPATASLLLTADGAGPIILTARGGNATSMPLVLATAAAPKLFPPTAKLRPGQSLTVSLLKDVAEQVVACESASTPGLSVLPADDGLAFELAADADLAEAATAQLTCRDGYGQTTVVRYSAEP